MSRPDPLTIRPARQDEAGAIWRAVVRAKLPPRDLDWRRTLVAEQGGRMVGVGQLRPHADGSHELASLAVLPAAQGKGAGSALVAALSARAPGRLYLFCREGLVGYYARLGFAPLPTDAPLPAELARRVAFGRRVLSWLARVGWNVGELVVMERADESAATHTKPAFAG